MKRLVCFLLIFILLLCNNMSSIYAVEPTNNFSLSCDDLLAFHQNPIRVWNLELNAELGNYIDYVYTPNNTIVEAKHYTEDYDQAYVSYLIWAYSIYEPYKSAECIGDPTTRYNCHSYAWYSQNTSSNNYWIPYPDNYYLDYSYCEVSVPREGDIICYFDDNGTPFLSDDKNIHSGIVKDYDPSVNSNNICGNANQVTVISKWGPGGLFIHRGDICVYTSNYGGDADYIKFFRPRTNGAADLSDDMLNFSTSASLNYTGNITDRYAMYEFDVEDSMPYLIVLDSNISLNVRFYDSNMNYMDASGFDIGNGKWGYIFTFEKGINYFRIQNVNETTHANVTISVYTHDGHRKINAVYEDDSYHSFSCECGEIIHEIHRWRDYSLTESICIDCGHLKKLPEKSGFIPIIKGITPENEAA